MESIRSDDAPAARLSPPPHSTSPRRSTTTLAFPSFSATSSGLSSNPSGHTLRRSVTVEDAPQFRRRPISLVSLPSSDQGDSPAPGVRRRSSTMSEFNLPDARKSFRNGTKDILNPSAARSEPANDSSSVLSSLPLAFALLPAIVGVFFEGGNALITDVMILGLVFIFLRYTITQPWQWYCEAQAVRIRQEMTPESVFDEESEAESPANMTESTGTLDETSGVQPQRHEDSAHEGEAAPEHENGEADLSEEKTRHSRAQEAAINELYAHEVLALLSCFLSPVLGAYLLHAVRAQLSRPSEGLLTDFNITVFLLAAELRPISHTLKLLQARTLHLQRIVQSTPVEPSMSAKLEEMYNRLAQLEQRADTAEEATSAGLATAAQQAQQQTSNANGGKQDAALIREVRNAIQPEIDALNRAVRRYERKATVLALQTESRLGSVDSRLNDAISLAAAAAKHHNNNSNGGFSSLLAWAVDGLVAIVTMPYYVAMYIIMWPFRTVARVWFKSSRSTRDRRSGSTKPGRQSAFKGTRYGSGSDKDRYRDRVPSRLSRRYSP